MILTSDFTLDFQIILPLKLSLIICHLNVVTSTTVDQQQLKLYLMSKKNMAKARSLSPGEELFMVLSRLRCGFIGQDLAHRYAMSPAHISRIWTTWITFLHQRLRFLPIWPSREFVDNNMPICFKDSFPKTRVIIYRLHRVLHRNAFLLQKPVSNLLQLQKSQHSKRIVGYITKWISKLCVKSVCGKN